MTHVDSLRKAQKILQDSHALVVLTGAGISAESGLKTFRDTGGLWEDHSIEDVATPLGFRRDPRLVWQFYNARRKAADTAAPNAAHLALARMESLRQHQRKMKPLASNGHAKGHHHLTRPDPFTLLTQNIDGLHQQAGSQKVVELHGSIWRVRCTDCNLISDDFPIELPVPPACPECESLLRPHVVWFGESLEDEIMVQAEEAVSRCDAFLVIGTSAVVQPAASYPWLAARRGVPVIEINLEATVLSEVATVSLRGKAGEILPKLL